MEHLAYEITVAIGVAALCGIIARFLRQPLMLAYIIAGALLGPLGFKIITSRESIDTLSSLGVAFLLFLVGLDLDFRKIKRFGKVSFIVTLVQVIFSGLLGFGLATLLGFTAIQSFYIAWALVFSSTVIGVKLLSERKALNSLHGRISIGLLVIQDIIAIFLLIFIEGLKPGAEFLPSLLTTLATGIVALGAFVLISRFIIIPLFSSLARSTELLFLASIAWCLAIAGVAASIGFSIEIGAFLAGLSLSTLPAHFEISGKVRSLRDFFLTIFFISLGAHISVANAGAHIGAIAAFSALVLIGVPAVVFFTMVGMRYTSRTSFLTSVITGQVSEFSLILVALGVKMGQLTEDMLSIIAMVAMITIALSSYGALRADGLYRIFSPILKRFEKKQKLREDILAEDGLTKDHFIVFGADRTGTPIVEFLRREKLPFIVIDFNPSVLDHLRKENIPCIFGDITNPDVDELARIDRARAVISTVPHTDMNLDLVQRMKKINPKALVIVTASDTLDARDLYRAGADYVIVPHLLGGSYATGLLKDFKHDLKGIAGLKGRHLAELRLNGNHRHA